MIEQEQEGSIYIYSYSYSYGIYIRSLLYRALTLTTLPYQVTVGYQRPYQQCEKRWYHHGEFPYPTYRVPVRQIPLSRTIIL